MGGRMRCCAAWWLWIVLLGVVPFVMAAQQDEDEAVTLTSFTLESVALSGVRPQGWEALEAGSYIDPDNPTNYLLHWVRPQSSLDEALAPLLPTMNRTALPPSSGTVQGEQFRWTLYPLVYALPDAPNEPILVDLAVAQDERGVYIVIFQASPSDYWRLRSALFLPALEFFGAPLTRIEAALGARSLPTVTLPEFALQTVVPPSWENVQPGSYMRQDTPQDITTLIVQSSPDLSAEDFALLLLEQLQLGAELPPVDTTYAGQALDWTLYQVPVRAPEGAALFQIATAEDEARSYLVVLLSTAEEAASLREALLLPVLDATRPRP